MKMEDFPDTEEEPTSDVNYALRLGSGLEFAEFSPSRWRLTVYHVLGISRQVTLGYADAYLLDFFIRHPGKMISRQELLDHAWDNRMVSQGSLNQAISNLRAILGDDQNREIIVTVPRRGYQFSTDVLIDWQEWLIKKQGMLNPDVTDQIIDNIQPPKLPTVLHRHIPALYTLSGILLISLLVGLVMKYYFTVFPPYVSKQITTDKTHLTLISDNQDELNSISHDLQPVLQRMDVVGGGHVLINRINNYLEFRCLRPDGTMYTLLVHAGRIQAMDNSYLMECLK